MGRGAHVGILYKRMFLGGPRLLQNHFRRHKLSVLAPQIPHVRYAKAESPATKRSYRHDFCGSSRKPMEQTVPRRAPHARTTIDALEFNDSSGCDCSLVVERRGKHDECGDRRVGPGSTLTTFTGVADGTEVNGLTVNGILFNYSLGNGQVTIDGGPGTTNNIDRRTSCLSETTPAC